MNLKCELKKTLKFSKKTRFSSTIKIVCEKRREQVRILFGKLPRFIVLSLSD